VEFVPLYRGDFPMAQQSRRRLGLVSSFGSDSTKPRVNDSQRPRRQMRRVLTAALATLASLPGAVVVGKAFGLKPDG